MKMKRLSSVIASVMLSISMVTTSLPIYAIDEIQIFNDTSSATTNVTYNQSSSFFVKVPKKITLGNDKTSSYLVEVNGDIDSLEKVVVVPDETVAMHDLLGNKDDVIGTITQDKTEWLYDEMSIDGKGDISALSLTAGDWSGTFNFNINLEYYEAIKLSLEEVNLGSNSSYQVNAFQGNEDVTELLEWNSNNPSITVNNGLIRTKASAKPGDSATITVSMNNDISAFSIGLEEESTKETKVLASMHVNVIDILFTNETDVINEISLLPGEDYSIEATIIPGSVGGIVNWSTTAISGIDLLTDGNSVQVYVSDDMPVNTSYGVIATYGKLSKYLTVNIKSPHVHNYVENIVESTCTDGGIKTYTCECGESYTENINALGHDYIVTVVEPTCTQKGYTLHECTRCDYSFSDTFTNALGHSEISSNNAINVTCTTDGKHSDTKCSVCGITLIVGDVIKATGHNYGDTTYTWGSNNSTCTASRTCSICGYIDSEVANSTYEITKASNCTESGVKTYTANFNNNEFETKTTTSVIPANGHLYEDKITSPTCVNAGNTIHTCSICGFSYTDSIIEALGHKSISSNNAVAATCTTNGKNSDTKCSVCGITLTTGSTISAKKHNYNQYVSASWSGTSSCTLTYKCSDCTATTTKAATITNAVTTAATCTKEGVRTYTATVAAWTNERGNSVAAKSVTTTASIAKVAHTSTSSNNAVAATCTTAGKNSDTKCSACGTTLTTGSTIAAKKHNYQYSSASWNGTSSCTLTYKCSDCSATTTKAATITNKVTTAATCTKKGVRTYTATVAAWTNERGNSVSAKSVTKTASIAKIAHTSVSSNNAVAATCTTAGKNSDTKCSACGTTLTTGSTIAKKGHNYQYSSASWNGTSSCTLTYKCSDCSATTTKAATVTSAVTKAATCAVTGVRTYTATVAAWTNERGNSVSAKSVTKTETIAKTTSHSYGSVSYTWGTNNADCTAKRTCSVCQTVQSEKVNSTNSVTTAATCTKTGVRTYTAKFANTVFGTKTTTSTISKTPHKSDGIIRYNTTYHVHGYCVTCGCEMKTATTSGNSPHSRVAADQWYGCTGTCINCGRTQISWALKGTCSGCQARYFHWDCPNCGLLTGWR